MPVNGVVLLASGLARAKNARRAAAHTHVVATATTASKANLLLRNLSGRTGRMLAPRWACTTLALRWHVAWQAATRRGGNFVGAKERTCNYYSRADYMHVRN